jgi:hypothetical protein
VKYACIVHTRLDGVRVYGPYDAERAIAEFQRWEARVSASVQTDYDENAVKAPDDPQEVELATFALSEDEQKRLEAEAIVRERA